MRCVGWIVHAGTFDGPETRCGRFELHNPSEHLGWRHEGLSGDRSRNGDTVRVAVRRDRGHFPVPSCGAVCTTDVIGRGSRNENDVDRLRPAHPGLDRQCTGSLALDLPVPSLSRGFIVSNHNVVVETFVVITTSLLCRQGGRHDVYVKAHPIVPSNVDYDTLSGRNILHSESIPRIRAGTMLHRTGHEESKRTDRRVDLGLVLPFIECYVDRIGNVRVGKAKKIFFFDFGVFFREFRQVPCLHVGNHGRKDVPEIHVFPLDKDTCQQDLSVVVGRKVGQRRVHLPDNARNHGMFR